MIDNQGIEFNVPSRPLLIEERELDSFASELEEPREEKIQEKEQEQFNTFDRDWLLRRCGEYITNSGSSAFTDTALCTDLFTILRSKNNGKIKKATNNEVYCDDK